MRCAVPFKILVEEKVEETTDGHTCVPMRFSFILLLKYSMPQERPSCVSMHVVRCREASPTSKLIAKAGTAHPGGGIVPKQCRAFVFCKMQKTPAGGERRTF